VALRITDDLMTSDQTRHSAQWRPAAAANGRGAWVCTRIPARLLDRNSAITAMSLAELEAAGDAGGPLGDCWRAELCLNTD
jgi:hypothetical protein